MKTINTSITIDRGEYLVDLDILIYVETPGPHDPGGITDVKITRCWVDGQLVTDRAAIDALDLDDDINEALSC